MSRQGKVWLVGAGPGDVGLFTIKGKDILAKAEVVVYDSLVGDGVLTMVPRLRRRSTWQTCRASYDEAGKY